jgi:transcriptional regulator with GAF, ATPase, and Fis domain
MSFSAPWSAYLASALHVRYAFVAEFAGVKAGTFRSDLYYRLNVFPLEVPPLRERRPDIPLLARHFLKRFARKLGKPLLDIAPSSMERLERYGWPGNIRELQNVIERAAVLARGSVLEIDDSLAVPMRQSGRRLSPGHWRRWSGPIFRGF